MGENSSLSEGGGLGGKTFDKIALTTRLAFFMMGGTEVYCG